MKTGLLLLMSVVAVTVRVHGAIANNLLTNFWYTDGYVYAVAETNGVAYIGGEFHYVGPETGPNAFLDPITGARDDSFPRFDGQILAIVPDGSGGWFVGGSFTMVGEHFRSGLVRLRADKTVDPDWYPLVTPGVVSSMAMIGNTLYLAGQFFAINGELRNSLAAIDATTATLTPWDPSLGGPVVQVSSIAALGNTIFVGGAFRSVGGEARTNLAAVNATTGATLAWAPNPNGIPTVLLASGTSVYVGGNFQRISGQIRTNFAALDATSGNLLPGPNVVGGGVNGFGLSGDTLYLGGFFSSLGGRTRSGLGAIDIATGAVTGWNPGSGLVGNPDAASVFSLVVSGGTVYACGTFTFIGGQPRLRIAALDGATGNALGFNPGANSVVRHVIPIGDRIMASGDFGSIGGAKRYNIAALDTATGEATAWDPGTQYYGGVNALVASSDLIYVGGSFTNIGGQIRHGIAALNPVTGAATSWNPVPNPPNPNAINNIYSMLLSGNTLYAGGALVIGGRTNAVALDVASGAPTTWNPSPSSAVYALAEGHGNIYAGGGFARIGGIQMSNLAALDPNTGAARAWNASVDAGVHALAIQGNTLFAGGLFRNIGGISRTNFGAIDVTTTTTNAVAFPNPEYRLGFTFALALLGSESLLAGGAPYEEIGGASGGRVVELTLATGDRTTWFPSPDRPGGVSGASYVRALAVTRDKVYVAGDFSGGLAVFQLLEQPTLTMPVWDNGEFRFRLMGTDGVTYDIEASDDLGFGFWQPIDSVTPVGGFIDVTDSTASFFNQRFYRAYAQ